MKTDKPIEEFDDRILLHLLRGTVLAVEEKIHGESKRKTFPSMVRAFYPDSSPTEIEQFSKFTVGQIFEKVKRVKRDKPVKRNR